MVAASEVLVGVVAVPRVVVAVAMVADIALEEVVAAAMVVAVVDTAYIHSFQMIYIK